MAESLAEQIIHKIDQASQLYYRLILIVDSSGGSILNCVENQSLVS
jgi:hypothetical protein